MLPRFIHCGNRTGPWCDRRNARTNTTPCTITVAAVLAAEQSGNDDRLTSLLAAALGEPAGARPAASPARHCRQLPSCRWWALCLHLGLPRAPSRVQHAAAGAAAHDDTGGETFCEIKG